MLSNGQTLMSNKTIYIAEMQQILYAEVRRPHTAEHGHHTLQSFSYTVLRCSKYFMLR
jgi:hypothetical protein